MGWIKSSPGWLILFVFLFLGGEGLNVVRYHVEHWLAYRDPMDSLWIIGGLLLAGIAVVFLGGFIHFRDRKRGKLTREGWRGRPVRRHRTEH
ncbi:DUF2627 family protein [Alicyclobacillaceae bacterium I2511]|nr:DUF2627 family protein [Alicyclobacillaceae bacterium I2511]